MILHNDCFPCFYYRNDKDERLYCAKMQEECMSVSFSSRVCMKGTKGCNEIHNLPFGKPWDCGYWSPEPGCDYEPETRESVAIEEVKAAIKRFEEGK